MPSDASFEVVRYNRPYLPSLLSRQLGSGWIYGGGPGERPRGTMLDGSRVQDTRDRVHGRFGGFSKPLTEFAVRLAGECEEQGLEDRLAIDIFDPCAPDDSSG